MRRFILSLVALVITSVCYAQNDNKNRDIVTKETATQFSNDQALLDIYRDQNKKIKTKKIVTPEMKYKQGKRMKTAGYIVGGTLLAGGIASMIAGAKMNNECDERLHSSNNNIDHYKHYYNDGDPYIYFGAGGIVASVAVGVPLIAKGSSLQKKYGSQVHSVSAISRDINFGNGSCLNIGVDVLSNSLSYNKTPGIGVRYNF